MTSDQPPRPWRPPVTPVVVERAFRLGAPFAPGGHRGLDLATRPGTEVRAPCAGRVTFRGRVAGGPPVLTITCAGRRATLGRIAASVAVGAKVRRSAVVGVATGPVVGLSARTADGRYVDPAGLLGVVERRGMPPVTRPGGRRPRAAPKRHVVWSPARLPQGALVPSPEPRTATIGGAHAGASAGHRTPVRVGGVALVLCCAFAAWSGARTARRRRGGRFLPGRAHLALIRR